MTSKARFVLGIGLGAAAAGSAVRLLQRRSEPPALPGSRRATGSGVSPWAARRRVVILGAGFGGLTVAEGITAGEHDTLDITLVDRRNYHLFTPFLYQASS